MTLILHLVRSLFHAFFSIVFTALTFGVIGGGGTLLVAYQQTHQWPPKTLVEVTAGVIAVLAAYAAGMTALVKEAIKGVEGVEKGVVTGVEDAEREVAGKH